MGYYAFEYQPAFLRSGIALAPLTMPIATASEPFVFADLPELTYRRLPGMLADALPDDFGNTLIPHAQQPGVALCVPRLFRCRQEAFEESFEWIAARNLFPEGGMGSGTYEKSVISLAAE